jgi:hypothetical protein
MVVTDTITVPPSGGPWSPLRDAIGPAWVRLTNGRLNPWRVDASLRTPRSVLDDPCDVAQRRIRRRRVVGCRSGAERAVRLWVPAVGSRSFGVAFAPVSSVWSVWALTAAAVTVPTHHSVLRRAVSQGQSTHLRSLLVPAIGGRTRRVDGHLAVSIAPVLNLVADPPAGVWGVGAGGRAVGVVAGLALLGGTVRSGGRQPRHGRRGSAGDGVGADCAERAAGGAGIGDPVRLPPDDGHLGGLTSRLALRGCDPPRLRSPRLRSPRLSCWSVLRRTN